MQLGVANRFEVRKRLGAGGMGVVYSAFDHHRGHEVALKKLLHLDPTQFYLFKSEFRSVAGIGHPNLVQLHELMVGKDGWFFTMELIEGVNFLRHVRPDDADGPIPIATEAMSGVRMREEAPTATASVVLARAGVDETQACRPRPELPRLPRHGSMPSPDLVRLRDVLEQLALAVMALHREGIVHRDLKPSNVLVTSDGRLVVCDFGIALDLRHERADRELDETMMGTLSYCAPEQLRGPSRAAESDWYSVGVMLYQALVGEVPARPRTAEDAYFLKTEHAPIAPRELNPELPEDLSELCLGLLVAEPGERLSGRDILRCLRSEGRDRPIVLEPREGLVARRRELELLHDAFRTAARGHASQVRVLGPPGMGKSALIRAFLDAVVLRDQSVLLLEARSYERESVPSRRSTQRSTISRGTS